MLMSIKGNICFLTPENIIMTNHVSVHSGTNLHFVNLSSFGRPSYTSNLPAYRFKCICAILIARICICMSPIQTKGKIIQYDYLLKDMHSRDNFIHMQIHV